MWRTLGSQCAVAFSCSRSVFVGLPRIAFHDAHSLRRTFASDAPEQDELRAIIRASFAKDAGAAASVIASELELTNQARVLHAFEDKTASANLSPKYLHDLFQHADENADGILSRSAPNWWGCMHTTSQAQPHTRPLDSVVCLQALRKQHCTNMFMVVPECVWHAVTIASASSSSNSVALAVSAATCQLAAHAHPNPTPRCCA